MPPKTPNNIKYAAIMTKAYKTVPVSACWSVVTLSGFAINNIRTTMLIVTPEKKARKFLASTSKMRKRVFIYVIILTFWR